MKKILITFLLTYSVFAKAQKDTTGIQFSDSTAIGVPDGKSTSKQIGAAGGTIVSEDGRVELIFPAGALTTNTEISIQPTTNLAPNGAGKSYWFEPSGIQFRKPVRIIFRYTDEEAEECPPDLMGMAMQDRTGKWSFTEYEEWDSLGKVLKGFIEHFSGLSNVHKLRLRVKKKEIRVNSRTSIEIVDISGRYDSRSATVSSLIGEYIFGRIDINAPVLWYVNGIENGDRSVGSIQANEYPIPGKAKLISGFFTAPEFLPKNPANVKVDIYVFSGKKKVFSRPVSLRCKVKIFAEYKVTVSQDINLNDLRFSDTSTFNLKISLEDRASISDIHNQLAKLQIRQTECKVIYINEANCVGTVNVTGIKTSNISPPASGDFAWVHVFFKPASFIFPMVHVPPCGKNKASLTTPSLSTQNAFPMWLSFQLKNEKQFISLGKGAGKLVSRPDPEDITATIEPIQDQ